jgi:hypothetical protein
LSHKQYYGKSKNQIRIRHKKSTKRKKKDCFYYRSIYRIGMKYLIALDSDDFTDEEDLKYVNEVLGYFKYKFPKTKIYTNPDANDMGLIYIENFDLYQKPFENLKNNSEKGLPFQEVTKILYEDIRNEMRNFISDFVKNHGYRKTIRIAKASPDTYSRIIRGEKIKMETIANIYSQLKKGAVHKEQCDELELQNY